MSSSPPHPTPPHPIWCDVYAGESRWKKWCKIVPVCTCDSSLCARVTLGGKKWCKIVPVCTCDSSLCARVTLENGCVRTWLQSVCAGDPGRKKWCKIVPVCTCDSRVCARVTPWPPQCLTRSCHQHCVAPPQALNMMPRGKGRSLNQLRSHSYSYTNPDLSNKKVLLWLLKKRFSFYTWLFPQHHRPFFWLQDLQIFPNSVKSWFPQATSPCWYGNSFPRLSPFLGKSMTSSWWMNLLPVPCHRRIAPAAFAALPLETWN